MVVFAQDGARSVWRAALSGPHGELVLSTYEAPGELEVWLTDIDGFYGGVGVESSDIQRKLGHGMLSVPARRSGRTLTLKGTIVAPGMNARDLSSRFTSSLLWDGALGNLTVSSDWGELSCAVRIDGAVKTELLSDVGLHFEVPLLAPEPWLYGPEFNTQIFPAGQGTGLRYPLFAQKPKPEGTLHFGDQALPSSVALAHEGNATAYPTYVVQGEWDSGFRLVNSGRVIEYPYQVHSAAPVTVDCHKGAIYIGGFDMSYLLTRREWHSVPARSGFQPRVESLAPSTGWVDVHLRDTYI